MNRTQKAHSIKLSKKRDSLSIIVLKNKHLFMLGSMVTKEKTKEKPWKPRNILIHCSTNHSENHFYHYSVKIHCVSGSVLITKGKAQLSMAKNRLDGFFKRFCLNQKKMVDRHNAYVYWNVCFWTDSWRTIFWFAIRIHLPSELLVEHLFPFSCIHPSTFFSLEFFVQLVTHCDDSSE